MERMRQASTEEKASTLKGDTVQAIGLDAKKSVRRGCGVVCSMDEVMTEVEEIGDVRCPRTTDGPHMLWFSGAY